MLRRIEKTSELAADIKFLLVTILAVIRFYIMPRGKSPIPVDVEHSFVEKVMSLFRDQVEKSKQEFENDDGNMEKMFEKFTTRLDNKMISISQELQNIKEQISKMDQPQISGLKRTHTKP